MEYYKFKSPNLSKIDVKILTIDLTSILRLISNLKEENNVNYKSYFQPWQSKEFNINI